MKDAVDRLRRLKIEKQTSLHMLEKVLVAGDALTAADFKVPIERDTVFVFADLAPRYNWTHPCEYHLYDAVTGKLYQKATASLPPSMLIMEGGTAFHAPKELVDVDTKDWKKSSKGIIPRGVVTPTEKRKCYAILFAGFAENRHTNDLEFLYRTLVDKFRYDPNNIWVLNYNGRVNYFRRWAPFDTQTVVGNWPGDNTPYRMMVKGKGTRSAFQEAIKEIATRIKSNDLLLIHTNNHGGGPCDRGLKDYCLLEYPVGGQLPLYYVEEFVADLHHLPRFKDLVVMMEQCRSGGFIDPIINRSPADRTHVATAVTKDEYSYGGIDFDRFARDWIAGINEAWPDGNGLIYQVDTNHDGRISATEAFGHADLVHYRDGRIYQYCDITHTNIRFGDSPTSADYPVGCGSSIFL